MSKSLLRALSRSSSLIIISSQVLFSSVGHASEPLDVVVTADRSEVPLKNTGSSITVITSDEIEKYGSKNIADVLRTVPGLTIAETGGLGGEAKVSLRGATAGGSMVLLDGIRIGDPSNTEGYFDFGNLSAANIERIEIVRGPQSALYGSGAMGGVINIITKKGKREPVREATLEGGSYGTISARGSISGATDKVSYSFGVNTLHSDGFPRYGYRSNNSDLYPQFPDPANQPVPKNDSVDRYGLNGTSSYKINETASIDTGLSFLSNSIEFDNPVATTIPEDVFNSNNQSRAGIFTGYIKAKFDTFGGAIKNQFSIFQNKTDRDTWMTDSYATTPNSPPVYFGYIGQRYGAEYQGDTNLARFGFLTFGLRRETEAAESLYDPDPYFSSASLSQTTNSAFAENRHQLTDQWDLSLGGRVDAIENGPTFPTWRVASAYRIDESETKFRFSAGTGARTPSMEQRIGQYGNPDLKAEESLGYDIGIDQAFFDNTLNLSLTYFNIDYTNKIGYQGFNVVNIGKVESHGLEFASNYAIIPSQVDIRVSYTYTRAVDGSTNLQVYRIPENTGYVSLLYRGIPKWELEPRLTYVGQRRDIFFNWLNVGTDVTLSSYLKLDFLTRYKVNDSNDAYVRFENLTDAHTEDAYNYGSAGRSVYVGWTTRW